MKLQFFRCFFLFFTVLMVSSCDEEAITNSGIEIPAGPQTELDKWIDDTFRVPYNISVQYLWNSAEINQGHVVVPPKEALVQPFLKAVLKIWLTPYIRVAEIKEEFMRNYTARQIILVGSGSYNDGGSVTLGRAANGYTITLFTVNQFDLISGKMSKATLNEFFRTMHHEFGHILNQRKAYDPHFQNITGNYTADWTSIDDTKARELGFISAYSRVAATEDFVEILSYYVTYTETEWQKLIKSIRSDQAKADIQLKVQSVSSYMKSAYGVDILELRTEITKAITEVAAGDLEMNENKE
jgi:substrate import-associated zinc metallohydrolase lipoprotein